MKNILVCAALAIMLLSGCSTGQQKKTDGVSARPSVEAAAKERQLVINTMPDIVLNPLSEINFTDKAKLQQAIMQETDSFSALMTKKMVASITTAIAKAGLKKNSAEFSALSEYSFEFSGKENNLVFSTIYSYANEAVALSKKTKSKEDFLTKIDPVTNKYVQRLSLVAEAFDTANVNLGNDFVSFAKAAPKEGKNNKAEVYRLKKDIFDTAKPMLYSKYKNTIASYAKPETAEAKNMNAAQRINQLLTSYQAAATEVSKKK